MTLQEKLYWVAVCDQCGTEFDYPSGDQESLKKMIGKEGWMGWEPAPGETGPVVCNGCREKFKVERARLRREAMIDGHAV